MPETQRLKDFEEIFNLYTDLCRHVSRIVRDMDAAEDIVQDVFVSFWDESNLWNLLGRIISIQT